MRIWRAGKLSLRDSDGRSRPPRPAYESDRTVAFSAAMIVTFSTAADNNSEHTVVFRQDGYKDVTCELGTSVGAGWIVLDVLGGLVPVVIDAATGKWNSLSTKNCNVNMREVDTN